MRLSSILPLVAALSLAALALGAATADKVTYEAPRLDDIKKLAGEWVELGEDGEPTDKVVSTMRVTAGGSAVLEVLFPGSAHEMVTVYHQDGDDLVLTHYCVAGNAPRMKARPRTQADQIVFECTGGANMKSEDDQHMHTGILSFVGPERLDVQWLQHTNRENTYTASFRLARRKH